jgi:hypothetical protein
MTDTKDMHAKQQYYVDCIERLRGGAINRLEWQKLYELLDHLSDGLPLVLQPVTPADKFARGRILDNREKFHSIRALAYPPENRCNNFGRCNRPQQPVLYAGVGTELIFSEIGAKPGDVVGLLHLSPSIEIFCARLGALNLWRRTSGGCLMGETVKTEIQKIFKSPENITAFLLDAFVSDYFGRLGGEDTYKLTSAYTAVILNSHPQIAGLIYDSVDHEAGACLAIKPEVFDTVLKPTEVQIVEVTSYLGYGIYDFVELGRATRFEQERIIWD